MCIHFLEEFLYLLFPLSLACDLEIPFGVVFRLFKVAQESFERCEFCEDPFVLPESPKPVKQCRLGFCKVFIRLVQILLVLLFNAHI